MPKINDNVKNAIAGVEKKKKGLQDESARAATYLLEILSSLQSADVTTIEAKLKSLLITLKQATIVPKQARGLFSNNPNKINLESEFKRRKIALDDNVGSSEQHRVKKLLAIRENDVDTFISIYHTILSLYRYAQQQPRWSYDYPLTANNEVQHAAIAEWQTIASAITDKKKVANVKDFKRTWTINNNHCQNEENITAALHSLLNDTNMTDSDKHAVIAWFKAHGGQSTCAVLKPLIASGEFSASMPEKVMEGIATIAKANWTNTNGKLELEFAITYHTLTYQRVPTKCIAVDANGNTQLEADTAELGMKHKQDNQALPPLLQISMKIQLEVTNGKVIPKVTRLHADSYSIELDKPTSSASPAATSTTTRPT